MFDRSLLLALFLAIDEAIRRIERRFSGINTAEDFVRDDDGLDRLDSISMMLLTISENIRRIERITGSAFLDQYPEIPWLDVKGIRNILSHDYFNIDAEEIYQICSDELGTLKEVIARMRNDI